MTAFVILSLFFINAILCYESSGSSELNRLEFAPLYETIIYSDIADILKDYENNVNSPIEAFINNDDNSESDENIEDLLSEYQHYLDKAHKQRKNYVEKSRINNKLPLLQRDRYPKSHATQLNKQDYHDIKYYNPPVFPFPRSPLDVLIPMNMMRSDLPFIYDESPKLTVEPTNEIPIWPIQKIIPEPKVLSLPPVMPSSKHEKILSSCYCKADTFPCECGCKQCLIAFEPMRKSTDYEKSETPLPPKTIVTTSSYNDSRNAIDSTINIRIKVDVQFPQYHPPQKLEEQSINNSNSKPDREVLLKESKNLMPFFNFPFPLEMFGFKKPNRNSGPIHKITIHRKKKSRSGSNGKRHRKKFVTFHDINIEQHSMQPNLDEIYNMTEHRPKLDSNKQLNETNHLSQNSEIENSDKSTYWTTKLPSVNESKIDDNTTDDPSRNDNSVETEYTKWITSTSTAEPFLREKRDVPNPTTSSDKVPEAMLIQNNSFSLTNETTKKTSKSLPDDDELLYWPDNTKDIFISSKNITNITSDGENKKQKLNSSTEMIRDNQTRVLEETIFGKVNWTDVDTVAPLIMSFMGKFMRGVLSFCSDRKCYSTKCEDKICLHRTCAPMDRTNNRGHCSGTHATDSVNSMESMKDLPSNNVFEIVDILQRKLLGKLFGKATLCTTAKCITFTTCKKHFAKLKCNSKDLNATGHCPITKNMKIM